MRRVLIWIESQGYGYVGDGIYDADYFNKYEKYAKTELGKNLLAFRLQLIEKYLPVDEQLLDIGIGSGEIVKARPSTRGYDVNPIAVDFLEKADLFMNPYKDDISQIKGFSMFDALEHLDKPHLLLHSIPSRAYLFVSIPIFKDRRHVLSSRHWRPEEHRFYFTDGGFRAFLHEQDFEVLDKYETESALGREDIHTYVLQKL